MGNPHRDLFTIRFEKRLEEALTPVDVRSTFNHVARAWLDSATPQPPDVEQWTGIGWKKLIHDKFRHDIAELNTPNSMNIRKLSKKYLEMDITLHWKWSHVSSNHACGKLDQLIELRGELTHRGKDYLFESKAKALRRQLVEAINLTTHLADRTANALNVPLPELIGPGNK